MGIQPKMLDPNPASMNPDPKHWVLGRVLFQNGLKPRFEPVSWRCRAQHGAES